MSNIKVTNPVPPVVTQPAQPAFGQISASIDTAVTPAVNGDNTGQPIPSGSGTAVGYAIGVRGNAPSGYGVYGHSGSQAGVRGESQNSDAVVGVAYAKGQAGISGQNLAAGGGLAGRFQGDVDVTGQVTTNNATVSGALTLQNPIQVVTTGPSPAAFVYTVAASDIYPDPSIYGTSESLGYPLCAVLNHHSLDGKPNALLFVTPLGHQSPTTINTDQGNVQGGTPPPPIPTVMAMYGASPSYAPPVNPPGNKPFVPAPVTNQWVLVGASAGQSFHILVIYTQA